MYLSYQKHFCLAAAPFRLFLSPIIPHDRWQNCLYLSRAHCFCKLWLIWIMQYSLAEIQYSVFCQRQTLQKPRRGSQSRVAVSLCGYMRMCVYVVKMKLFILKRISCAVWCIYEGVWSLPVKKECVPAEWFPKPTWKHLCWRCTAECKKQNDVLHFR